MGLWRYSLAAMIVFAALLDVLWWVPMYSGVARQQRDESIQATMPQCRRLQLERELDRLERELDATLTEIDATRAKLHALE